MMSMINAVFGVTLVWLLGVVCFFVGVAVTLVVLRAMASAKKQNQKDEESCVHGLRKPE